MMFLHPKGALTLKPSLSQSPSLLAKACISINHSLKIFMTIQRRKILQSATLLPLMAAVPGVVQAQSAGLAVGAHKVISASSRYVGAPQNQAFQLGLDYLQTNGARGVFFDIVPEATNGGHAGICFHAAPNVSGAWQNIGQGPSPTSPVNQLLWFRGVGVIFQQDGRIQSEQWVVGADGKSAAANVATIGYFPANTILRVATSMNNATRQMLLIVYSVDSSTGDAVAELGRLTLQAEVFTSLAGVFVIGGGSIQVQPYALYP